MYKLVISSTENTWKPYKYLRIKKGLLGTKHQAKSLQLLALHLTWLSLCRWPMPTLSKLYVQINQVLFCICDIRGKIHISKLLSPTCAVYIKICKLSKQKRLTLQGESPWIRTLHLLQTTLWKGELVLNSLTPCCLQNTKLLELWTHYWPIYQSSSKQVRLLLLNYWKKQHHKHEWLAKDQALPKHVTEASSIHSLQNRLPVTFHTIRWLLCRHVFFCNAGRCYPEASLMETKAHTGKQGV